MTPCCLTDDRKRRERKREWIETRDKMRRNEERRGKGDKKKRREENWEREGDNKRKIGQKKCGESRV